MEEAVAGTASKGWMVDLLCIALLLVLNPVTFYLTSGPVDVLPDSAAYIVMGSDILSSGRLFLPSWGHLDIGLVLPPLYPLLIGAGRLIFDDGLVVARYLTSLLMLVSSVLLYLFARKQAGRPVAACAVLLVQANFFYLKVALTPLTEAAFICTLSAALLFGQKLADGCARWKSSALLLGVFSALVYFSRQIGIVVLVFFILFTLVRVLSAGPGRRVPQIRCCSLVLLGLSLLVVPYLFALHAQTGRLPVEQRFRMGNYAVHASDEESARRLEEMREYDPSDIYALYAKRREWMQLLPDGSEMYAHVLDRQSAKWGSTGSRLMEVLRHPQRIAAAIAGNFGSLAGIVGWAVTILFLVTTAQSLLLKEKRRSFFSRALLPLLVLTYLFSISLFTDLVERYLQVVFPFVVLQVAVELHATAVRYAPRMNIARPRSVAAGILIVLLAVGGFSTPRLWHEMRRCPPLTEQTAPFSEFRVAVSPGDPVMSILAPYTLYVGGTYRYLPNDTLDQTVRYARLTGVRWLLVTLDRRSDQDIRHYTRVHWFTGERLDRVRPDLLRFAGVSNGRDAYLYEVLPDTG